MILICPKCRAQYKIDATPFPPKGRKVKCKSCGHVWVENPIKREKQAKRKRILRRGAIALAAFFVIAGFVGYISLPYLAKKIPALAPYAQTLHPAKPPSAMPSLQTTPFAITQARYTFQDRPEGRALVVQGRIENTADALMDVPTITVKLFNTDGAVIYTWLLEVDKPSLEATQQTEFIGRLMYPPEETAQVSVEVAPQP